MGRKHRIYHHSRAIPGSVDSCVARITNGEVRWASELYPAIEAEGALPIDKPTCHNSAAS
jgi:hypothetical protein